jgi:hypothetical protein
VVGAGDEGGASGVKLGERAFEIVVKLVGKLRGGKIGVEQVTGSSLSAGRSQRLSGRTTRFGYWLERCGLFGGPAWLFSRLGRLWSDNRRVDIAGWQNTGEGIIGYGHRNLRAPGFGAASVVSISWLPGRSLLPRPELSLYPLAQAELPGRSRGCSFSTLLA